MARKLKAVPDTIEGTFDAHRLAVGWMSTALASSTDKEVSALHNTVCVEWYDDGVRLVATDSYMLMRAWLPFHGREYDAPEPDPVLVNPIMQAVARDTHGRARSLFAHVYNLTSGEDALTLEAEVHVGPAVLDPDRAPLTLAHMDERAVVIDVADQERLVLPLFDGAYPAWSSLVSHPIKATRSVMVNPEFLGRLGRLSKWHGGGLTFDLGGATGPISVTCPGSDPAVAGLLMPMRGPNG